MYNSIICRYHEIATKGNNRNMFERCLVDNISHLLREVGVCRVHRVRGRIWVNRVDGGAFSAAEMEAILPQLAKAFGLESFSPAVRLPVDMDAIRSAGYDPITPVVLTNADDINYFMTNADGTIRAGDTLITLRSGTMETTEAEE